MKAYVLTFSVTTGDPYECSRFYLLGVFATQDEAMKNAEKYARWDAVKADWPGYSDLEPAREDFEVTCVEVGAEAPPVRLR